MYMHVYMYCMYTSIILSCFCVKQVGSGKDSVRTAPSSKVQLHVHVHYMHVLLMCVLNIQVHVHVHCTARCTDYHKEG